MAAALRHEATARPQGAIDASNHSIGGLNPVKHRVTEDGIELLSKRQIFRVHDASVEAEFSGCLDLRRTGIHADHLGPKAGDLLSEGTIAATEIENPLARLGREKIQDR